VSVSAGYGRRWTAEEETVVATVPIGYGDGWRRGLTNDADALIGGRRVPLVGTVSMDNITFAAPHARVGDEVVLLGTQGEERVSAEEIAYRLGTINYEVTCGLSARVPRRYHRDGVPEEASA
jgi:alanine racemase